MPAALARLRREQDGGGHAAAQADPKVRKFTDGMALVKTIVVPGRLVNLIVKPQ